MGKKLSFKRLKRDHKEMKRWKSHSAITPGALMTLGLFFGKMAQVGEFLNLSWGVVVLPVLIGPAYSFVSLLVKVMGAGVRDGFLTWARGPESNSYGIHSLKILVMVVAVLLIGGFVEWSWAVFAWGLLVGLFSGFWMGVLAFFFVRRWLTD